MSDKEMDKLDVVIGQVDHIKGQLEVSVKTQAEMGAKLDTVIKTLTGGMDGELGLTQKTAELWKLRGSVRVFIGGAVGSIVTALLSGLLLHYFGKI